MLQDHMSGLTKLVGLEGRKHEGSQSPDGLSRPDYRRRDRDRPGYCARPGSRGRAGCAIDWAGHANLALQYDVYHMQIMEGDLSATLERIVGRIGHIQFADPPGRHEPGTGEINFPRLFETLDRVGYDGWIGAEYVPSGPTEETLGWFEPFRRS